MKNLQFYALLMLLSTGYIAHAQEESWSVRHDIRILENHMNRDMSRNELMRFIDRVHAYIKALQDENAAPTAREMNVLDKSCSKVAKESLQFPGDQKLQDAVARLREQSSMFLATCTHPTCMDAKELEIDVVEIQSGKLSSAIQNKESNIAQQGSGSGSSAS